MRSFKHGKNISEVDVQGISPHGIWLYVKEKEYFLSFKDFSWFKKAGISDISNVHLLHGYHLYWPTLDIDIELESLDHPEQYPLIYS